MSKTVGARINRFDIHTCRIIFMENSRNVMGMIRGPGMIKLPYTLFKHGDNQFFCQIDAFVVCTGNNNTIGSIESNFQEHIIQSYSNYLLFI